MPVLKWEKVDNVAKLVMDNGENRHNPVFVAEFREILDEIEADYKNEGLVITSSDPKSWSLGIDLNWIMAAFQDVNRHDEIRKFLHDLNILFKRVLTYPMPVIASINGHAFGDGSIFSCACDFRFMLKSKGFFCFPEIDVNIPFIPGMAAIVKKALPYWYFEEMSLTGKRATGEELEKNHVVTKALDTEEELLEASIKFAGSFKKARGIFGAQKERMNAGIIQVIDEVDPAVIKKLQLLA